MYIWKRFEWIARRMALHARRVKEKGKSSRKINVKLKKFYFHLQ